MLFSHAAHCYDNRVHPTGPVEVRRSGWGVKFKTDSAIVEFGDAVSRRKPRAGVLERYLAMQRNKVVPSRRPNSRSSFDQLVGAGSIHATPTGEIQPSRTGQAIMVPRDAQRCHYIP